MTTQKTLAVATACALCLPVTGHVCTSYHNDIDTPDSNTLKKTSIADTTHIYDIDEVVVTTPQKDLHRLRKQPISSTTLSSLALLNSEANDLRDVALQVPSFVMPAYGTRYTSSIYIRGIGSRVNSPSIGMYVDDIPLVSKSAFNTHLYDIGRIDILRGPNGTLYGLNAEGGLIRIYTKSPSAYNGTEAKFGFGSFMQRNAEINHYSTFDGIGSLALSAFYSGQDGFQRNEGTGQRADKGNETGARIKFERRPNSHFDFKLIADWQHVAQNGFAYGALSDTDGIPADPETNRPNTYNRDVLSTGFSMRYKTGKTEFSSTTSYQHLSDRMSMDQDYTATDYLSLGQRQAMNAITEEITAKNATNATWKWVTGMFMSQQWLRTNGPVGFGEGITTPIGKAIESAIYNGMLKKMTAPKEDGTPGMPEAVAKALIEKRGGVSVSEVTMDAPGLFHSPQFNAAIFHESTISLGNRAYLTLGLRYDMQHVSIDYDTYATMAITASVMGTTASNHLRSRLANGSKDTFSQFLPKVGLSLGLGEADGTGNWRLGNVYASASKGYRAGGFNIQMFSDIMQTELMANRTKAMSGDYDIPHTAADYANVNATIAYKPETNWNYEVGAHLNLMDNALSLDAAVYLMTIRNQQLSVMAGNYGYGRMMVNAGRSISTGLELALRGTLMNGTLAWNATYGYTHAEFRRYTDGDHDYRGKRVPYVPSHTMSANADYTIACGGKAVRRIIVGMGMSGQGDIYWDEGNTFKQDFYAIMNAHIRVELNHVYINLWGKNLSDTRYCTFALDSAASGTTRRFGQRGTPISMGIDLGIRL